MEKVRSSFKLCSVGWVFISKGLDSHAKLKKKKRQLKTFLQQKAQVQEKAMCTAECFSQYHVPQEATHHLSLSPAADLLRRTT